MATQKKVLLQMKGIKKHYPIKKGILGRVRGYVKAVDGVTLDVHSGETLGIVGESGCGKTTLAKGIVRLYRPTEGEMLLTMPDDKVKNLLALSKEESFSTRRRIQMVFQNPYASFNPMKSIYTSFEEPMSVHKIAKGKAECREKIAQALQTVNLQPDYMYRYPHEFSGGQRQRICIARALALEPELIVCDEPVSSLDVSIQAQILNLMRRLQRERRLTYVFIAHDLSTVQYMSDRIAVMYLGKVVELANAENIHRRQLHPYTQVLMSAVPVPSLEVRRERIMLTGDVPSPINPPSGCHFHPRCQFCMDICKTREPQLKTVSGGADGHMVACHLVK